MSLTINQDAELLADVVGAVQVLEQAGDSRWKQELERLTRRLSTLKHKVSDLYELLGAGSEEDRAEIKAQINSANAERSAMQVEHDRIQACVDAESFEVTADQVREVLASFHQLLTDGAAGHLGQDVVHRAAAIFRMLVGGRIMVVVEKRPQRKTANVRGVFLPNLLRAVQEDLNDPRSVTAAPPAEVSVWLP